MHQADEDEEIAALVFLMRETVGVRAAALIHWNPASFDLDSVIPPGVSSSE